MDKTDGDSGSGRALDGDAEGSGILHRSPLRGLLAARLFLGGQLVFTNESRWTRLLHNFAVFAIQREFFRRRLPFLIVPVRV